ncbi:unnamed protein product [Rotaria socialis]|uniref:Uncharacterized protein n=1 Tax=Rotaria socialis TaxID=392032 RepID=A0A820URH5_9BILA|nr:unnamed protein product [Rotaria socialis]CAF3611648.1 unnamed protein product [Rotaria socialis]CAF3692449.1 unnamed protein product [Rotaria socialis]CAF4489260.1 unnamed protein product [Rotaria socialis]CAF4518511.1 unnamed protein product [Rotaria socialis]
MNEKVIHSFEGVCPLTYYGVYGIKKSFNMPNFPCSDKSEQLSLKKHLMYKHNLSNTAANKIVIDRMNNHINEKQSHNKNDLIFNNTQELFSHSVHWHKGRCPFSYGFNNVFNLTLSNNHIKNYNCRHAKQCLLLSHLRVSHNLNIKSAKKIVKTMMTSSIESKQKSSIENDIREIILFQKDDAVLNTNPNIYNDDRRFRHYCPLTNITASINEDIQDQSLLNVPCNKTNEKFILFAHLQHYHQMSGELALRLIRSIRTSTESTVINELIINNNKQSTSTNNTATTTATTTAAADEIDIVPYKCLCPYSTTSNHGNSNLLKKFIRFVKNIPCDRPCPVNLYRHLRNYHKVDLQHAKDITRTIMLCKTVKSESLTDQQTSTTTRKRTKKATNNYETTISLVHVNLNSVNSETKNESIDFLIDNENPEDWDSSMINDEESLFLSFDEERLNGDDDDDDIDRDF